jgi:hypothetical protein
MVNWNTKDSAPNDSKHFPNSVRSRGEKCDISERAGLSFEGSCSVPLQRNRETMLKRHAPTLSCLYYYKGFFFNEIYLQVININFIIHRGSQSSYCGTLMRVQNQFILALLYSSQ